jgi:hypothetical protein
MSWRFRQSFKIMPGVRLNLSRSGLSASIGGAPFTINAGPRGVVGTASIPGTGISFRQRIDNQPDVESPEEQGFRPAPLPSQTGTPELQRTREIRSAGTEVLTSQGLKELKVLIQTAYEEFEEISQMLNSAKCDESRATKRFVSWDNGFLFKKMFKQAFAVRKSESEIAAAKVAELAEQLRQTSIAVHVELASEQAGPYFQLRDRFEALADCAAIWNINSERAADKLRERTNVDRSVERQKIKLSSGNCDLMTWEERVPHFQNSNGGDLYIYPGFILYRAARKAFSVIDCHDVRLEVKKVQFNEPGGVPDDSETVGTTWAKVNKDGSRDKRFAGNYQIPIASYGDLTFKTTAGLEEEFQFSNPQRLYQFEKSWMEFLKSFQNQSFCTVQKPEAMESEIKLRCPHCGQHVLVSAADKGREFHCPNCDKSIRIPETV